MSEQNKMNNSFIRHVSSARGGQTVESFKRALVDNLYYVLGQGVYTASKYDLYVALSYTVREILADRWRRTVETFVEKRPKFVYYLSAEYLLGQQITQNLLYTGLNDIARQSLDELGFNLDDLVSIEPEPALGNGGLGRLAACYLDSLATLDIPSVAYGINYQFGIFKQSFVDGWQVESPDEWMYYGNPWAFPHPDNLIEVGFGGHTEFVQGADGRFSVKWIPAETILGLPSHILVPGYNTDTVNMIRLWNARASKEFDFQLFDVGDYTTAAEQKIRSENISKVLYPNDNTPQGRELRLKQEYFFAACSIRDILRRFFTFEKDWDKFPDRVVIQLNDTHPVVAVPELMRILVDEYGLDWERSWTITSHSFAYTCHTLMPEALEKWPVSVFEKLLPRHLEIIYEINRRFLDQVRTRYPHDEARITRMSIIEETPVKSVRMAFLASVACFSINGVAELHTHLLQQQVLHDFHEMWPERFNSKTNGVSPRRFMKLANPRLSDLITRATGSQAWLSNLDELSKLETCANDQSFQQEWRGIKLQNKKDLAVIILNRTGVQVDSEAMFDVMVKRLHEYKRQLLKVLHIITLYNRIKAHPGSLITPRVVIFGAKAAPGYRMAKLIIKLINSVAGVVNNDPAIGNQLKVAFLPNFNVTLGEKIYPAAELSEQISLAGYEASGTGNMKFALNGALTVGTLDGANIEIREHVGAENFFLFGMTSSEARALKASGFQSMNEYQRVPELKSAVDSIASGVFSGGDPELFQPIVHMLLTQDTFMHLADYAAYIDCQDQVDRVYQDTPLWTRMSILNTARCGFFSSDRAVRQYAQEIWKAKDIC